ncbi:MAG: 1-acyl-sn-glycerol-3-phosphate acyltransferase [SAR202 cluster bacterium]|nr:1-acyl-sn-glycerol-3-phosphate acyltransferase [SAR202 cluster bacterium]
MEGVYPLCNFLQKGTLRIFGDWKVTGAENVPPTGPLVIVANHMSNMDPSLLAVSISRRIRFLAKDGLFKLRVAEWFLRSYGAFPVNREGVDVSAYRWTLDQIKSGGVIVLFPEGTRNHGRLIQAKSGVANLVMRTKAPILPVGITGTERLGSIFRVLNPTGRIRVNIGEPFSLPDNEGKPGKDVMESMMTMVMHKITDLLPEEYHGVYTRASD